MTDRPPPTSDPRGWPRPSVGCTGSDAPRRSVGSAPNRSKWTYDTGPGSNVGTSETGGHDHLYAQPPGRSVARVLGA